MSAFITIDGLNFGVFIRGLLVVGVGVGVLMGSVFLLLATSTYLLLVQVVKRQLMARLIPNARLQVMNDGHIFLLSDSARCAGLVGEFLGAAVLAGKAALPGT